MFHRDVTTKKDREPMSAEYERYRELKLLLREYEATTSEEVGSGGVSRSAGPGGTGTLLPVQ